MLPEHFITELSYLSLGYKLHESAQEQGITEDASRSRRRKINKFLGTRTMNQAVVEAINLGYIPITLEEETEYQALSPTETAILQLVATGWRVEEIAKRLELSRHTVNAHYAHLRSKLGARTIIQVVRRAYESGIFKIGEEITDPLQEIEDRLDNLYIAAGSVALKATEIGISKISELELITLLPQIQNGEFTQDDFLELGFYADAESPTSRAHAYGRAISSVKQKLNASFEQEVIGSSYSRKSGVKKHRHYIKAPIAIGTLKNMVPVSRYEETAEERLRAPRIRMSQMAKRRKRRAQLPPPAERIPEPTPISVRIKGLDDYLEASKLPDLTPDFFATLVPRDTNEVLENDEVKLAMTAILTNLEIIEHRSRVINHLRYGIPPPANRPLGISRKGQYVDMRDVMRYVPSFQGLSVASTSQIVGLKPLTIVLTEKTIIGKFQSKYPALSTVVPFLHDEIRQLAR